MKQTGKNAVLINENIIMTSLKDGVFAKKSLLLLKKCGFVKTFIICV